MLRIIVSTCLTAAALLLPASGAWSQQRFALVIGNSQYKGVAPLPNPARDAAAVSALLKQAGFQVATATDLDKAGMSRAIRAFAAAMADKPENTVALVYFAGHGLQVDGENYLVPVDAAIARESDVPLESMRLADLMATVETIRSRTRIVFLDACRNNPFTEAAKTAPQGLALVNAPAGTLIAYSTSPGTTAEDGDGSNSPFAVALLRSAKEPGLPIETLLKNVRLAVHGATAGRQTPWEVSSLIEPFAFFPGSAPLKEEKRGKDAQAWRKELQGLPPAAALETAVREDDVIVYEQYLALYASDPQALRVRALLDRRQMMIAWLEAVTLNAPSGFAAFLARYPDSDLAATARRLEQRAKARASFARSFAPVLGVSANALSNQPEIRTVVREVKVPEIRTVIQEVKVPSPPEIRTVVKEVVREVKVPHEVVKTVSVPVPCACPGRAPGPRPGHRVDIGPAPVPVVRGGIPTTIRVPGPRIHAPGPRIHNAGPRIHGGAIRVAPQIRSFGGGRHGGFGGVRIGGHGFRLR